ncbi:MAG: ATP-binding cassette domain-containing protein [Xanthobacteraceae bacterium]|nr:ATP-binding cassette domain-containing protein [Xanthobacteraceae bacterium]
MAEAAAIAVPALEVDQVSYFYGARAALDGVSLRVDPSSFTVLLGLNGAGKSTLFSLITRLYASPVGHIRIFGHDVGREPGAALRNLGIVFQSKALDADISVRQNLLYHAALHGIGRRRAEVEIDRVLAQVKLGDKRGDRVASLSIGQMRRIEIARALLHRPRLLLLDEATAGLDIRARADILAHVRQLVASEGVGVLWATHLIDEVDAGDQVVVLHKGRVLAQGSVQAVVASVQAADIGDAFARLTGAADANTEQRP